MTYTRRQEMIDGFKATIPLVLGAIPFGIIYGAMGPTVGLSPAATIAMSLFVFAGASQFIAVTLIDQETGILLIVFTTFIVNLRHMLYSASLAPLMSHLKQRWLLPLGFWLTDETYAVSILRYQKGDDSPYKHYFVLASALFMYINWQLCTIIGVVAGQILENAESLGLEFAMVVTFIGIVVPMIVNRPMLVAAIVAGGVAIVAKPLPNNLGLFVASLVGIIAGVIAERIASNRELDKLKNEGLALKSKGGD